MIETAAVIGAGVMGTGIARHMAENGLRVTLIDSNPAQLQKAAATLAGLCDCSPDLNDIANADYVIEAVFEDISVKRAVLAQICKTVGEHCVVATNTSSLLVGDLAVAVTHPNRFVGVHYNNPADFNPIVEIICATETDPLLADRVQQWISAFGKTTIRCADTPCFILNRQSLPYINEAARCLDIASPGEIDTVATAKLGVGLGPFAVMNLVGLPVMAAASRNLSVLGPGYLPAAALQDKAASGHPEWIIEVAASVPKAVTSQLVRRLRGAMIFPGKDILEQQLCSRTDLHRICIEALGYEKSSAEWLEILTPAVADRLITDYLAHQA